MRKIVFGIAVMTFVALLVTPAIGADESNMKATAESWVKEYNSGNFEAVAAMYATDGCRMPPNQENTAKGTQGIVAQLKAGKAQGADKIAVTVTSSETMGDMGWATGTYELTRADGKHIDHGKWMNVSKKANAVWKIQCDIWNSNMDAPKASM